MKATKYVLLALLACQGAFAAEPAVSDASLRELIEVTQSRKLLDSSMAQIDTMMRQSVQQSLDGRALTAEQQSILEDMQVRMIAILKQEMTWDSLEPVFLDIYRKSFTQGEVDGMLAFYRTPAGQALIAKMPLVMQHTMEAMQSQMGRMMPKLRDLQRETVARLEATETEPVPVDLPPAPPAAPKAK